MLNLTVAKVVLVAAAVAVSLAALNWLNSDSLWTSVSISRYASHSLVSHGLLVSSFLLNVCCTMWVPACRKMMFQLGGGATFSFEIQANLIGTQVTLTAIHYVNVPKLLFFGGGDEFPPLPPPSPPSQLPIPMLLWLQTSKKKIVCPTRLILHIL